MFNICQQNDIFFHNLLFLFETNLTGVQSTKSAKCMVWLCNGFAKECLMLTRRWWICFIILQSCEWGNQGMSTISLKRTIFWFSETVVIPCTIGCTGRVSTGDRTGLKRFFCGNRWGRMSLFTPSLHKPSSVHMACASSFWSKSLIIFSPYSSMKALQVLSNALGIYVHRLSTASFTSSCKSQ